MHGYLVLSFQPVADAQQRMEQERECLLNSHTRGACNHALPLLGVTEMGHLVVGTSELERKDRLKIFAFESDIAFQAVAEIGRVSEWCCLDDIVDLCSENQA